MSSLQVKMGGRTFKNPVVVGSGPLTARLDRIKRAEEAGAAAVSIKHTLLAQPFEVRPRWFVDRSLGMVVSGDPRLSVEQGQELIRKAKAETGLIVFANMSGKPDDLESWGFTAKRLAEAGADFIEVNFNCPNLLSKGPGHGTHLGSDLGSSPEGTAAVIREVKAAVNIPVIGKMMSEGGRLLEVAKACQDAGVDVINVRGGSRAAYGLDIYHGGRPLYPGLTKGNFGGLTGPWSRLMTNRWVADVSRTCQVPLIGGSGITKWEHVVETIMWGAQMVQVFTAILWHGFKVIEDILASLPRFMDECGYASLNDFRSIALDTVITPGEIVYSEGSAFIDPDRCNGCKVCTKLPACDAIEYRAENKKCHVTADLCVGCGLCIGLCPVEAIHWQSHS